MANRDVSMSALCTELGIKPVGLYKYADSEGQLREQGRKILLGRRRSPPCGWSTGPTMA